MTVTTRRDFLAIAGSTAASFCCTSTWAETKPATNSNYRMVAAIDRRRILSAADKYLSAQPITVTASHSPRSSGGPHDYFSEGDYWWPDPKHPGGPYIRRDGMSNPDNFNAHRLALIRLSLIVPALAAAWELTGQKKYADHASLHLRAWFVDPATRMNPNLQYAQAIYGVSKGRGTGLIDTLHLVEPARAATVLMQGGALQDARAIQDWFVQYLEWMRTSKNGQEERDAKNNHGTCWVLQAAEFSRFTGNHEVRQWCRDRFRTVLVPHQIAPDGSLPLELARTKPYSYSLFDMDVLSDLCQSLSTEKEDLWHFTTPDGRGMKKLMSFMFPFIQDKSKWPYPHDVEYWNDFPVRQPSLLFSGLAYNQPDCIALWKTLNPDPSVPEVIRNYPVRQPLLWLPQNNA
ncbi:alginate lyase family protein [Edaphobacter sp.]|uniref:alginate lyase family protein n=1 Tax=Edaphobacter sp. TaxID=1934404 RepID=UPI002DBF151F|nr:alginate lyase family protein [Edaphobacter sp.]HEU5340072.1 alginate lyase family protein [Edaphobacter sp.]